MSHVVFLHSILHQESSDLRVSLSCYVESVVNFCCAWFFPRTAVFATTDKMFFYIIFNGIDNYWSGGCQGHC